MEPQLNADKIKNKNLPPMPVLSLSKGTPMDADKTQPLTAEDAEGGNLNPES